MIRYTNKFFGKSISFNGKSQYPVLDIIFIANVKVITKRDAEVKIIGITPQDRLNVLDCFNWTFKSVYGSYWYDCSIDESYFGKRLRSLNMPDTIIKNLTKYIEEDLSKYQYGN